MYSPKSPSLPVPFVGLGEYDTLPIGTPLLGHWSLGVDGPLVAADLSYFSKILLVKFADLLDADEAWIGQTETGWCPNIRFQWKPNIRSDSSTSSITSSTPVDALERTSPPSPRSSFGSSSKKSIFVLDLNILG